MTEAGVINIFTVVRILLVGGILIVIPLITRKGLLFGVYVGEAFAAWPRRTPRDRQKAPSPCWTSQSRREPLWRYSRWESTSSPAWPPSPIR